MVFIWTNAYWVPRFLNAENMDNSFTMEGPLSKWTNLVNGWQYRWFVLDISLGVLSYYTVSFLILRFHKVSSKSEQYHIQRYGTTCILLLVLIQLSNLSNILLVMHVLRPNICTNFDKKVFYVGC